MWGWDVSGRAALPVLTYMETHSLLKGKQASLAIELISTFSQGMGTNQWGRNGMPEEIRQKRVDLASEISNLNKGQVMLLAEECPICHTQGVLFVPYGDQIACVDCVAKENGEDNAESHP